MVAPVQTQTKKKMKFRLVAGIHYSGRKAEGTLKKWIQGDVLESEINLTRRHRNKFVRVPDETPVSRQEEDEEVKRLAEEEEEENFTDEIGDEYEEEPDYESMTLKQLKEIAQQEEIEITSVSKKDDLIKLIRSVRESRDDE
jgi:hypothetical protein